MRHSSIVGSDRQSVQLSQQTYANTGIIIIWRYLLVDRLCYIYSPMFNLHLLNGGEFFPPDHFYRDISGRAKDEDISFRDFS